jgi:cell division protein FtsB
MPIKRTIFLLIALAALQYPLWAGKGNVKEVRQLGAEVTNSKADVEKLEQRNRALSAQIQDLKQGQEAVAEIARDELGYISNGEHYYRVKP